MKQYWIIKEPPYSTWVSDKPLFFADAEEIHVIEAGPILAAINKIKRQLKFLNLNPACFGAEDIIALTKDIK